jgi:raffinose/stachyose/melibiose transport system substrate-binding protein
MKKIVASLTVIALLTVSTILLAGCTPEAGLESSADTGSSSFSSKEKLDLKIINFRVEDQKFYTALNEKFERTYPEVTILYDAVPTTQYNSLLDARIAAGEVDIFGVQTGMELTDQYATNMLNLDNAECLQGISDEFLFYGKNNGVQLSLPLNTVSMVVFYNKQLFKDNAISIPVDWAEFIAICKAFQSKEINPIMYGGKDQWPVNMVFDAIEPAIIRSDAPEFYADIRSGSDDFQNPLWKEVWTKLAEVQTYFQPGSSGLAYSRAPGLFAQGAAAMMIDGSWSLSQIIAAQPAFEFGAFVLPTNSDSAKNNMLAFKIGSGLAVSSTTEHSDYALNYLKMHMEDVNYQEYIDLTMMGSVKGSVSSSQKIYDEFYNGSKKVLLCENSLVIGMPWNVSDYGTRILLGKMTPEEAYTRQASDIAATKDTWSLNTDIKH